MSKRARQYIGILAAIAAYYLVHEGAHLIYALFIGVFQKINFMGLGVPKRSVQLVRWRRYERYRSSLPGMGGKSRIRCIAYCKRVGVLEKAAASL